MKHEIHPEFINPCRKCENRGCGKHAECEKYMAYFNAKEKLYEMRRKKGLVNSFQSDNIEKVKKHPKAQMGKYRPKEYNK